MKKELANKLTEHIVGIYAEAYDLGYKMGLVKHKIAVYPLSNRTIQELLDVIIDHYENRK